MNKILSKPISFKLAKLVKEKGFESESREGYDELGNLGTPYFGEYFTNGISNGDLKYEAPTIAEMLDYIFDKYGILVNVNIAIEDKWYFELYNLKSKRNSEIILDDEYWFESQVETYEFAIKYILLNLIK